jgi:hypothetical protein
MEFEDLTKNRWHEWLSKPQFSKRFLVGGIFLFFLTLFLNIREVQMEMLDLGSISERYIIAQVDFEFPDEEATMVLKQESVRDIGAIYQVDEKQAELRRGDFENYLINNQEWRQNLDKTTFEKMYNGASDLINLIIQSRFTNARTLQKMRDLHLPTPNIFLFNPSNVQEPLTLPKDFWKSMHSQLTAGDKYQPESATYIINFFKSFSWNLQEDLGMERTLRVQVQESVPMKYTKVEAGSHIIDPGEIVSPRHLAMLKAMKNALGENRSFWSFGAIFGSLLLASIIIVLCIIYLQIHHRELLNSLQKLTLLVTVILLTLFLAKLTEYFLYNKASYLIDVVRYPLFVPFASIIICVLIGPAVALFTSGFLVVILTISLAVDQDRFLISNLIVALVSIVAARSIHKRKELFTVCAKAWLSCVPVIVALNLMENDFWNLNLMSDLISTFFFLSFTAILVVGLLPVLESVFRVMTDMSLMEYMDPNNELLRRLSLEAPGTYQHSLVVGNLAETAARAIGANGLFCRVSTLYHDIGKLFNPNYFTENQLGGFNIHQLLTPLESAHVIIAHVSEGETLARKYRLPQSFIDIIKEHHGTTLVYYFYCKQMEQKEGDPAQVDEKAFRYPGPKPRSKESAIIMIADTVEAASRSMEEMSEQSIADLVEKLVSEKTEDNQFDECQLTFEELGIVKKTMIKTLLVASHLRIKYPSKA